MIALAFLLLAPEPLRLTLDDAVARARTSSARLAQARDTETASTAAVRAARAGRLPALDVSGSYTRQSHVPELTLTLPGIGERTVFPDLPNAWRSRAAVSVPVWTGGRVESAIAGARELQAASAADVQAAEADVVLQTVEAYWALATARERETVLRKALESYDSHLKDARNRLEEGVAARNEVLAVEVERARGELAQQQAAHAADLASDELARLVGAPPGTPIEPAEPLSAAGAGPAAEAELAENALARRAEIAALRRRVAAAEAQIGIQRAARRPQASATAAYDFANPNARVLPLRDEWKGTWSVGAGFTWSAWDGGRSSAAVAQAAAQASALRHQLEDVEGRVRVEVLARARALSTARESVEVAERALAAARENVDVAADRYREGVASSSDLLDAETVLLRAGLERTQALAETQRARAALDRALGPQP